MTTATTAYRDYDLKDSVMQESSFSLSRETFADPGAQGKKSLPRRSPRPGVALSSILQFDLVDREGAVSHALGSIPMMPKEPESELAILVRSQPIEVRRVKVRIVSRTVGVPNPILPDAGE